MGQEADFDFQSSIEAHRIASYIREQARTLHPPLAGPLIAAHRKLERLQPFLTWMWR